MSLESKPFVTGDATLRALFVGIRTVDGSVFNVSPRKIAAIIANALDTLWNLLNELAIITNELTRPVNYFPRETHDHTFFSMRNFFVTADNTSGEKRLVRLRATLVLV